MFLVCQTTGSSPLSNVLICISTAPKHWPNLMTQLVLLKCTMRLLNSLMERRAPVRNTKLRRKNSLFQPLKVHRSFTLKSWCFWVLWKTFRQLLKTYMVSLNSSYRKILLLSVRIWAKIKLSWIRMLFPLITPLKRNNTFRSAQSVKKLTETLSLQEKLSNSANWFLFCKFQLTMLKNGASKRSTTILWTLELTKWTTN